MAYPVHRVPGSAQLLLCGKDFVQHSCGPKVYLDLEGRAVLAGLLQADSNTARTKKHVLGDKTTSCHFSSTRNKVL